MAITKSLENGNTIIDASQVRDVVFPLFTVSEQRGSWNAEKFLGTGFLIGNKGFIMTATHVIKQTDIKQLCALAVLDDKWIPIEFKEVYHHPLEDVSILKTNNDLWQSFLIPSNTWEGSSCPYQLWGYPDIKDWVVDRRKSTFRPDLCYYESYIVRRITSNSDEQIIKGKNLFELGFVGHSGCSGSPIIKKGARSKDGMWKLIGIYTGNSSVELAKRNTFKEFLEKGEIDTKSLLKNQHIEELFNLINNYSRILIRESYNSGIAVREDGIKDWLRGIDPSLYYES